MRLKRVTIRKFRNILDTSSIDIDPAVTCLVGKNESGKTAVLHALHRLLPADREIGFSIPEQYPAWMEKRDRMDGKDLESVSPITAVFELDSTDKKILSSRFGKAIADGIFEVEVRREYSSKLHIACEVDERDFVSFLVGSVEWPRGTKTAANKIGTIDGLREYANQLDLDREETGETIGPVVESRIADSVGNSDLTSAVSNAIRDLLPGFLYFADYSSLPYSVDIKKVLTGKDDDLDEGERTARSLLKLAAADDEYLADMDYERRKRELENVANAITRDVKEYWTQNSMLRVMPDITQKSVNIPNGKTTVIDELKLRIWDERHQLSLRFDEHSTGFRWFFSFLAAFSHYERTKKSVTILLDEPALGLHARAQSDFLRFIKERLATKNQVIYTTHSPFMIEPDHLERIRMVEDKGPDEGATVTSEFTSTDPDTLFPLQGALGYDLSQHLFIGTKNLVVEGTSDYTYLRVISDHMKETGLGTPLMDDLSIVPVGGVDLVPTFVALIGHHLELTVLVDSQKGGHQKLNNLAAQGLLNSKRIIMIGSIIGASEGDIEDLFDAMDYLLLVNVAFETNVEITDLKGNGPIVRKIARCWKQPRFDHGKPADTLLRKRDELLPRLSKTTIERFSNLFEKLNRTFAEEEGPGQ